MATAEQQLLSAVDKFMDDIADRIFELSQLTLIDENKTDSSTMFKTANVVRKPFEKTIVYPAPYSDVIEFGRNPGSPVYSKWLHKWVERKLGITDPKRIKSVSFAIAKSIQERGLQATNFLTNAAFKARSEMESGINE